jgi:hypothetical protein
MENRKMKPSDNDQSFDAREKVDDMAVKRAGPTEDERADLVRALQKQALTRNQDPLASCVELLCGDAVALAFQVRESMSEACRNIAANPSSFKSFETRADLFLRLTRQIDRLARITRQRSTDAEA